MPTRFSRCSPTPPLTPPSEGATGLVNAQRLEIVLAERRQGDLAVGQYGDLRAVRSMHRKRADAIDEHLLYIGEVLHPEECEFARRHVPNAFDFLHFLNPFSDRGRVRPSHELEPTGARLAAVEPILISTFRTRLSASGRIRSMCSSPLSSNAPLTSMPSARTKDRWNWRAAMPR